MAILAIFRIFFRIHCNTYIQQKFTSVIATVNPNAPRKLVLACHYESKIMKDGAFLAATDSAVPCAMMLNLAYVLDDLLVSHWSDISLQSELENHIFKQKIFLHKNWRFLRNFKKKTSQEVTKNIQEMYIFFNLIFKLKIFKKFSIFFLIFSRNFLFFKDFQEIL